MTHIDKRYLRYVPARMRPYLTWLDRQDNSCDHSHVYFLVFEKDGVEQCPEPSDTVDEIAWNCKQLELYEELYKEKRA